MFIMKNKRKIVIPMEALALFSPDSGIRVFVAPELGDDADNVCDREGAICLPFHSIIEDAVKDAGFDEEEWQSQEEDSKPQQRRGRKIIAAYLRMWATQLELETEDEK